MHSYGADEGKINIDNVLGGSLTSLNFVKVLDGMPRSLHTVDVYLLITRRVRGEKSMLLVRLRLPETDSAMPSSLSDS